MSGRIVFAGRDRTRGKQEVCAISAYAFCSGAMGLRFGDELWSWGANYQGELNTGATTSSPVPGNAGSALEAWRQVSMGSASACGIRTNGSLYCWGSNSYGQLGVGDDTQRASATRVGTEQDWKQISVGTSHVCGLRGTGSLWCWGSGFARELGSGTSDRSTPMQVGTATNWQSVSAGTTYTCGVDGAGAMQCWGRGLGMARVGTDVGWTSVDTAETSACSVRAGRVWCWGSANPHGQLGNGTRERSLTPVEVSPGRAWSQVSAEGASACAVGQDGTLWCWGGGAEGQTGSGRAWSETPVRIADVP